MSSGYEGASELPAPRDDAYASDNPEAQERSVLETLSAGGVDAELATELLCEVYQLVDDTCIDQFDEYHPEKGACSAAAARSAPPHDRHAASVVFCPCCNALGSTSQRRGADVVSFSGAGGATARNNQRYAYKCRKCISKACSKAVPLLRQQQDDADPECTGTWTQLHPRCLSAGTDRAAVCAARAASAQSDEQAKRDPQYGRYWGRRGGGSVIYRCGKCGNPKGRNGSCECPRKSKKSGRAARDHATQHGPAAPSMSAQVDMSSEAAKRRLMEPHNGLHAPMPFLPVARVPPPSTHLASVSRAAPGAESDAQAGTPGAPPATGAENVRFVVASAVLNTCDAHLLDQHAPAAAASSVPRAPEKGSRAGEKRSRLAGGSEGSSVEAWDITDVEPRRVTVPAPSNESMLKLGEKTIHRFNGTTEATYVWVHRGQTRFALRSSAPVEDVLLQMELKAVKAKMKSVRKRMLASPAAPPQLAAR